jgi:two-component system response regulator
MPTNIWPDQADPISPLPAIPGGLAKSPRPPVILLLEDEPNDALLFQEALNELGCLAEVQVVESIPEGCAYLEGTGKFQNRRQFPIPNLIVSDFKLGGQTGGEFFKWVRAKPAFNEIIFVFLSGSALPRDQDAAMRDGAHGFFDKTTDWDLMKNYVMQILQHLPRG